jgi:hypothetical protein
MDLANPVPNRTENENGLIIALVKELTGLRLFRAERIVTTTRAL